MALVLLLPTALFLGGRAYGQWRDFEKAQKLFLEADMALEHGQTRQAIPMMQESIALCPDMLASWEGLSFCYAELGENEKALDTLDQAIARFPKSPLLYGRKATLLRQLKRYEMASATFAAAFALEPDNFIFQRLQRDCDSKLVSPTPKPSSR